MAWWRGRRRFNGLAFIVLVGIVVLGIGLPIIVSFGANRLTVRTSTLVAAPRDSFVITTPIALGLDGLVTIERGALYPADSSGRALSAPLSAAQLASGTTRYMIENGQLRIQAGQQTAAGDTQSPMIDALSNLQFETLMLRNTSVHVQLPDGRTETISDIDGEVTQRRKSTLTIKGKGALRGQKIDFEATSGVLADQRPGATIPIKLTLKSSLLEVTLDGRAGFVGPAQLQGAVDISIPHVRQVAHWFGAVWPAGKGLRNLTGHGQLEWAGASMAFNRATLLMDGNEAHGTLNLKFVEPRPSIGGTLAFKALNISEYFPLPILGAATAAATAWQAFLEGDLSLPLLTHFDADVRLSADKVLLHTQLLGRSAVTVTVSQGRMLADIGAIEFDGGRGSGQISADASGPVPKFAVRGKIDDVDAARTALTMFGHPVLSGRATLTTDILTSGRTGSDFLNSANGRLNLAIRNGGKIGVDLQALAIAVQKRSLEGWGAHGRSHMSFDELDASFSVRSGTLVADDVSAKSGDVVTRLKGTIEIPASRLNVLVQQEPAENTNAAPARSGKSKAVEISGQWKAPTIRSDTAADRAAAPPGKRAPDTLELLPATTSPARL